MTGALHWAAALSNHYTAIIEQLGVMHTQRTVRHKRDICFHNHFFSVVKLNNQKVDKQHGSQPICPLIFTSAFKVSIYFGKAFQNVYMGNKLLWMPTVSLIEMSLSKHNPKICLHQQVNERRSEAFYHWKPCTYQIMSYLGKTTQSSSTASTMNGPPGTFSLHFGVRGC